MKILKDDGRREKQKQKRRGRKEERLSPLGSWKKEEEQVCTGLASPPPLPPRKERQCSDVIWSCGRGANNEEEVRKQRTADQTKRVVNLLGFPTLNHNA